MSGPGDFSHTGAWAPETPYDRYLAGYGTNNTGTKETATHNAAGYEIGTDTREYPSRSSNSYPSPNQFNLTPVPYPIIQAAYADAQERQPHPSSSAQAALSTGGPPQPLGQPHSFPGQAYLPHTAHIAPANTWQNNDAILAPASHGQQEQRAQSMQAQQHAQLRHKRSYAQVAQLPPSVLSPQLIQNPITGPGVNPTATTGQSYHRHIPSWPEAQGQHGYQMNMRRAPTILPLTEAYLAQGNMTGLDREQPTKAGPWVAGPASRTPLPLQIQAAPAMSREISATQSSTLTSGSARRSKQEILSTDSEYKCNTCGAGFTQRPDLAHHVRSVHGNRKFQCATCGNRFFYPKDRDRHQETHSNLRMFFCSELACKYHTMGFKRQEHLDRHLNGSRCPAPVAASA